MMSLAGRRAMLQAEAEAAGAARQVATALWLARRLEREWGARRAKEATVAAIVAVFLACGACAPWGGTPTADLTHGINGKFHVLLGTPGRVSEACRGMGVEAAPGVGARGCYLKAGDTHWLWAAQDAQEADTLAHEWRHSLEGAFHP